MKHQEINPDQVQALAQEVYENIGYPGMDLVLVEDEMGDLEIDFWEEDQDYLDPDQGARILARLALGQAHWIQDLSDWSMVADEDDEEVALNEIPEEKKQAFIDQVIVRRLEQALEEADQAS